MNKKNTVRIYLFLFPTLLMFILFFIYPVISVFITSFTQWNGISDFTFVGLDNFVRLFTYDNTFWVALKNLLLWCLIIVGFHVPFGGLVAYLLYKNSFGANFVKGVYMIPSMIAASAWAIMYRFIFNDKFGVINNLIRSLGFKNFNLNWFFDSRSAFIAVTLTWVFYAIVHTLLILAALQSIPKEIHESAEIDGASGWRQIISIDIPLIKRTIASCMVLALAGAITQFEVIFMTTRGGPGNKTYNLAMIVYDSIMSRDYGLANATSVLMIIVGISILLIANKIFGISKKEI